MVMIMRINNNKMIDIHNLFKTIDNYRDNILMLLINYNNIKDKILDLIKLNNIKSNLTMH